MPAPTSRSVGFTWLASCQTFPASRNALVKMLLVSLIPKVTPVLKNDSPTRSRSLNGASSGMCPDGVTDASSYPRSWMPACVPPT